MEINVNSQVDSKSHNPSSSLSYPHNLTADSKIVSHEFKDIDACAKALKPSNLKIANQLTPGGFQCTFNQAQLPGVQFTHVTQNQTVQVKGAKPTHVFSFTMIFPSLETSGWSHGTPIKKWDLFGFDMSREINLLLGKDAQIVMVHLNRQAFQSLAQKMGYEDLEKRIFKENIAHFHPRTVLHLRAYYQQISQILVHQPALLKQPPVQSLIMADFLPLLMDTLGASIRQTQTRAKTPRRYPLIQKAEELMYSYREQEQPLTLQHLCDSLETSSTALSVGFQEVFGLSPMIYLKIQRLNGVRRALKKANPKTTTVMQVAQQWGFWSLNHFSRDYREMFGELPSQTLKIIKNM